MTEKEIITKYAKQLKKEFTPERVKAALEKARQEWNESPKAKAMQAEIDRLKVIDGIFTGKITPAETERQEAGQ